ncbi:MAG: NusG domain II-containing protein [Candidatus Ornithospirochaeta sp.]
MNKRRLADVLVIVFFLVVSLLLFLLIGKRKEGSEVRVMVEGKEIGVYSLSRDGEFSLNGGTNTLIIKDGKAYMADADCPDKLCVRQGKIHRNGETITCLPNKLTVTVIDEEGEVDLVL